MMINYGLIAIGANNEILHFCGYEYPPNENDCTLLSALLQENESYGVKGKKYRIEEAPMLVVNKYKDDANTHVEKNF